VVEWVFLAEGEADFRAAPSMFQQEAGAGRAEVGAGGVAETNSGGRGSHVPHLVMVARLLRPLNPFAADALVDVFGEGLVHLCRDPVQVKDKSWLAGRRRTPRARLPSARAIVTDLRPMTSLSGPRRRAESRCRSPGPSLFLFCAGKAKRATSRFHFSLIGSHHCPSASPAPISPYGRPAAGGCFSRSRISSCGKDRRNSLRSAPVYSRASGSFYTPLEL